jgi:hypothetical protein
MRQIKQCDSGRNVSALGGGSIGHCEKKNSYEHVHNSELYRDRTVYIYKYKNIMNANKDIEITYY